MLLFGKKLEDFKEADLLQFQADEVGEDRVLEYKLTLPGTTDNDRKEFLADVSSMANAGGGVIFYGVKAVDGMIQDISGLPADSIDQAKLDLESRIRTGIQPRIQGLKIDGIMLQSGATVLYVGIPRSFYAPHMVTFKDRNKFYSRNSAGKYLMDVTEIRNSVLGSAELTERIDSWVSNRISLIQRQDVMPMGSRWAALHIVPAVGFLDRSSIDFQKFSEEFKKLYPFGTMDPIRRFNLEGYILYAKGKLPMGDEERVAYAQAFRFGQLEQVHNGNWFMYDTDRVTPAFFEVEMVRQLKSYFAALQWSAIEPPFSVHLFLSGMNNLRLLTPTGFILRHNEENKFLRDQLQIPSIWIDTWEQTKDVPVLMRPIFDALWNSAGLEGSPNYDEQGNQKLATLAT